MACMPQSTIQTIVGSSVNIKINNPMYRSPQALRPKESHLSSGLMADTE